MCIAVLDSNTTVSARMATHMLSQFAEREWGEALPLEQRKAEQEYAALCHFHETLPGSVPRPYFLDCHHRSSEPHSIFSPSFFLPPSHFPSPLPSSLPLSLPPSLVMMPCPLSVHAVVMEDVSHYHKVEELLTDGELKPHLPAIASALGFIGLVHHSTWLAGMEEDKRKMIREKF